MNLPRLFLVVALPLTGVACKTNPFSSNTAPADPYASNYAGTPVQGGYAPTTQAPTYPQYQTPAPAPADPYAGSVAPSPVAPPSFNGGGGGGTTHTVVPGDTLYGLSRRYGSSVGAIKSANGLTSDTIVIGQQLRLP